MTQPLIINSPMTTPPPVGKLSILQHLVGSYKLWIDIKNHIPISVRHTLAGKIEHLPLETLEHVFIAQYSKREKKISVLQSALTSWDTFKFFLQIAWETKNLPTKHYEHISLEANTIGKMLWSWKQSLENKTPASAGDYQQ